jgi:hypothetical protein
MPETDVERLRRLAEICRRQAKLTADPQDRKALNQIAVDYERQADRGSR